MKKLFVKSILTLGVVFAALTTQAQDPAIKGYFRIQNVGNGNFVEVSGPFTAKPNVTAEQALNSAGTVMYVEAVQDKGSYRLTHLRCQGIDVADDCIDPSEYESIIGDLEGNLNSDLAYTLVRKGFQYGYTSIARATVGTVLWFVASKLDGKDYGDKDNNGNNYEFVPGDYIEVARDFNREVTAKLDLGIRMKPVSFDNKTVQVYFDVPSLQPVCEWYLDKDAKIFERNPVSRHEVFASAMRTMSGYLAEKGINLETFTAYDVELLKGWQYDITKTHPANAEGEVVLTFHDIFSDPVLLFNWIKMVGYYILNPGEHDHGLSNLGYSDLADKAQNHYLTKLLVDYLPRLHYNTRAYLIDGRIGAADSFGGSWDGSQSGTLGFASEYEMGTAGDHGVWALCPIVNDETQKFVVKHKHTAQKGDEKFGASALYFDFPVTAVDDQTSFFKLSEELFMSFLDNGDMVYVYNKVIPLTNFPIERLNPFVMKTVEGGSTQLLVGDGQYTFNKIEYTPEEETVPDNSLPIGDDETVSQYSFVSPLYLTENNDTYMNGVLLPTSLNNGDLSNLWGEDAKTVYPFNQIENPDETKHVGFSEDKSVTSLAANEAVYVPVQDAQPWEVATYVDPATAAQDLADSFVYIGDPVPGNTTGIEQVAIDNKVKDNKLYNLMGQPVKNPTPGNVYILNGKKFIVK